MAANVADRPSFGDASGLSRRLPEFDTGPDKRSQAGAFGGTTALTLDTDATLPGFGADRAGRLEEWLPSNLRRTAYLAAKRGFDLAVASLLLLVLLPAWLLTATLVTTTSPGPILFKQRRTGQDGRVFTCLTFRTMVIDAEARFQADPALAVAFSENWKLDRDPRVTGIGRVLRKTSLDELPQVLNILRGDMSVVGPGRSSSRSWSRNTGTGVSSSSPPSRTSPASGRSPAAPASPTPSVSPPSASSANAAPSNPPTNPPRRRPRP